MSTLSMVHGDTAEFDSVIANAAGPINLTGATIRFTAKASYEDLDAAAIVNIVSPTDITIVNAAAGMVHIRIPPAATSAIPNVLRRLAFDLSVTKGADKWTVDSGQLIINPEVAIA
jgi:hypothetical protein